MQYKRENFRVLLLHTCTPQVGVQKSFFAAQHRPVEKKLIKLFDIIIGVHLCHFDQQHQKKEKCLLK